MPKVLVFMGPITSGKGTQALWAELEKGFVHLESTAVIREQFDLHPDNPVIIDQKEKVRRGDIVDPPVILEWMKTKIRALASLGKSIAFSGSPRSLFEAAGDENHQGIFPLLEELYDPKNLFFFYIEIDEETALHRSSVRLICEKHNHPIPDLPEYRGMTACPWDGSALGRRKDGLDDDPAKVQKRYREYVERMGPILEYAEKRGYIVHRFDGTESIEGLHHKIFMLVERQQVPVPRE